MAPTAPSPHGALRFHLTPKSGNAKTGPIPVSTSSATLCPADCGLRGNGCYAESWPLALHWRAVTNGSRGMPWPDFLAAIAALPPKQLWRHNQAGDLYDPGTVTGAAALAQLTEASRGRRGFTYSHHRLSARAIGAFKAATAQGFTVNASCESEAAADVAMAHGLRAIFVVAADDPRTNWRTEGGNRAIVCPSQRFAEMTCERCQLCYARPQNTAIAFRAHGTQWRKVESALGL